jgi:hypothetical protein
MLETGAKGISDCLQSPASTGERPVASAVSHLVVLTGYGPSRRQTEAHESRWMGHKIAAVSVDDLIPVNSFGYGVRQ